MMQILHVKQTFWGLEKLLTLEWANENEMKMNE